MLDMNVGKRCALIIAAAFYLPAASAAKAAQDTSHWKRTGEAALSEARKYRPIETMARNLILFVGDGMGVSTVTAARILAGQTGKTSKSGEEHLLSFERFPNVALSKTYSANQQVSDSAPTMTAMVTGVKTNDGMLSVGPEVERCSTDPARIRKHSLPTLLETAEDRGLATGIVTTARITHATPAALYAHTTNRDWESDGKLPAGVRDIARQLVQFAHGDGIDVVLGGGRGNFYARGEDASVEGTRKAASQEFRRWRERADIHYVRSRAELLRTKPKAKPKLLGLFNDSHMEYEVDRISQGAEPSLTEMTEKAIEFLKGDPDGYFLMVEAGRIDHGHHAGNAYRALNEAIQLSKAVKRAVELAGEETLIIVTADHSHVLTIAGYPRLDNPILGKVVEPGAKDGEYATDLLGLPYTTLGYANGPGYPGESLRYEHYDKGDECARRKAEGSGKASTLQPGGPKHFRHEPRGSRRGMRPDLRSENTEATDYLQESMMPMASETHGGEDVAIYATGPMAHLVHGVMEQNALFYVMREALGLPAAPTAAAWRDADRKPGPPASRTP
jgi:alkaline phosphatase